MSHSLALNAPLRRVTVVSSPPFHKTIAPLSHLHTWHLLYITNHLKSQKIRHRVRTQPKCISVIALEHKHVTTNANLANATFVVMCHQHASVPTCELLVFAKLCT